MVSAPPQQAEAHAGIPLPFGMSVLAALFDGAAAGVGLYDTDLRYVYVNPALALIKGLPGTGGDRRADPEPCCACTPTD
ncbi:hypothetical protein ACFW5D_21100 [Streptomyces sp. NPDC058770]|uniref:hypothetical protein n=1 Tax=Streptomyces sp. NPDC058770 TaxID=3346631 RepID=UPI0036ACC84F